MSKTFYSTADILNAVYSGGSLNATTEFGSSADVLNAVFDSTNNAIRVNLASGGCASYSALTISGELNAGIILSGGTNLYDIFITSSVAADITRVQPGTNTSTGGTANYPTVNVVDNPSFSSVTMSGTATAAQFVSGSTNLNSVFAPASHTHALAISDVSNLQGALDTKANLTGTTNFTGVIQSGGTDLYDIFITSSVASDVTRVQPGTNTTTGGTDNLPTVNVVDNPSFSSVTMSGTATAVQFVSGSTNLNSVFAPASHTHALAISDIDNLQGALDTKANLTGTTNFTGAIQSGGTDLYAIFLTEETYKGTVTSVTSTDPNITVGGTSAAPTLAIADSPAFGDLSASGTTTLATVNATTYNTTSSNLSGLAWTTLGVALSDETTAIASATTASVTLYMPYSMTFTEVVACLTTSGSTISTLDVHQSGSTVFSTNITIDANEFCSLDATTQPVISQVTLVKGQKVEFFIDAAGTGAKGAKIFLNGYKI